MPHFDARPIVQIDVKDDAERLFEIVVLVESFGRSKQEAVVAVFTQQPLYTFERTGVIVNDKNFLSIWQRERMTSFFLAP